MEEDVQQPQEDLPGTEVAQDASTTQMILVGPTGEQTVFHAVFRTQHRST